MSVTTPRHALLDQVGPTRAAPGWIGTAQQGAIEVARGDNPNDQPDFLFTLRVKGKHDE
jgi:hypothetical protein